MSRRFLFDVESTSTVDLKKTGAAVYWAHPDTQIILLRYRVDAGPVVAWDPKWGGVPYFVPELSDASWRVVAHNYLFEFWCWYYHLNPKHGWGSPHRLRWDCTMARASYWGLPPSLGMLTEALNTPNKKDTSSATEALMKRMARPRTRKPALTWWHETDPQKVAELGVYCDKDILAECDVDDILPPLPARERKLFDIDHDINTLGIACDLPMVYKLQRITDSESERLNGDMARLTGGRATTTNQTGKILQVLNESYTVPDLTKATVAERIETLAKIIPAMPSHDRPLLRAAMGILQTRQEAAKASTAKLASMRLGANPTPASGSRLQGLFQYGGAGRTMRWAGRRVQPQNYPRGTLGKHTSRLFELLEQSPDIPAEDFAMFTPGTVMDAVSGLLRGCLVAAPGKVLVSGDLSQIEARVVLWLAGQDDVLDVFKRGDDVYSFTAAKIGSTNRQLGKICVLGLGFGMGAGVEDMEDGTVSGGFVAAARAGGIVLSLTEAKKIVHDWRELNAKVVEFWWACDEAFRDCIRGCDGYEVRVGHVTFKRSRKAVQIILPAPDKKLTYQNVELVDEGNGRTAITYMGVNSKTHAYERIRTYGGRLVENIVQAVARDVMAEAMICLDKTAGLAGCADPAANGVPIVGTVHDELIVECEEQFGEIILQGLLTLMRITPPWAFGLPCAAEGWVGKRYRK